MDYPLCDRTVTVYHRQGEAVTRRVVHGCWYHYEDVCDENLVQGFARKFLLIQPGENMIYPGDRIFDGEGPETVDWDTFLPVNVPGLSQAAYATPWQLNGQICHVEAGRK